MLIDPGWREDDLKRIREDIINYLRVTLADNNDEELGNELLLSAIFAGHPYQHHNFGTVFVLNRLTLDDLRAFYKANFTQSALTIGIAGGYPAGFEERVQKDFSSLPIGSTEPRPAIGPPALPAGTQITIVQKPARSIAYSLGFPIDIRRGSPDFPALLLAQAWLGPHRSGGRLFQRMREVRGLNYGDYAYIEHFPNGMFTLEPEPNIARHQQIFRIWIRPVAPPTAHFALRLALFELNRFIKDGLSEDDFEQTRNFLSKYVKVLTRTASAQLGYAIDSRYYDIPEFTTYIQTALARLTRDDVNRAIRKYLDPGKMVIVAVAQDAEDLRTRLVSNTSSPMMYNSPKDQYVIAEDKIVSEWKIPLRPESVRIVKATTVFQ